MLVAATPTYTPGEPIRVKVAHSVSIRTASESGALGFGQQVDVEMRRVVVDEPDRGRRRVVDRLHEIGVRARERCGAIHGLGVQRPQARPPRPLAGLFERQRVDGADDVAERTAAPVVDHPREVWFEGEIRTEPDVPGQRWLVVEVRRIASPIGRAQAHVVQRRRIGRREPAHEHLANVATRHTRGEPTQSNRVGDQTFDENDVE